MITKFDSLDNIFNHCPKNTVIVNNYIKAWDIINNRGYNKILCAISGGSDSDIMLDICYRCDINNKIDYVWFDTGLEYQATKDHLVYLQNKYNIIIKTYKAIKPIPLSCKQYGQPFISKQVSEYLSRLQKHNFKWEDKPFEVLYKEYPKCRAALLWWCNEHESNAFNIRKNKWLREFIIENPPEFLISSVCCKYSKKDAVNKLIKDYGYDLSIVGVRKAEGGLRSIAYKNCFDDNGLDCDNYRPLFWYQDTDKQQYKDFFKIINSKCYIEYGLKRTGCAGCPFGRDYKYELSIIEKYEPKLYKAVINIFKDSYAYMDNYRYYVEQRKKDNEARHKKLF